MKKTIQFGAALVAAVFFSSAANASIYYTWVPDAGNSVTSDGSFYLTGDTISDFTFSVNGSAADTSFSGSVTPVGIDAVLSGASSGGLDAGWAAGSSPEDVFSSTAGSGSGTWVDGFPVSAVPEPSTILAGASVLLPFGASTLRILRRRHAVK
jgi:hypothetical protein